MTTAEKVALHNTVVKKQIRRTFLGFDAKAPGVLKRAPKGYYFNICNMLIKNG